MRRITYLVSARRSPSGKFLGSLSRLTAAQIGAQVAKALLRDAKVDPFGVDDVLVGQVLQAGAGQNPARQVALGAGLPDTISACTINKVCGSGLQSIMFADMAIRSGDAELVVAGGMESMSQAPFLSREMRAGNKYGNTQFIDSLVFDGLINIYDGDIMGALAEGTAAKCGVDRRSQDEFAAQSHQRAAAAEHAGAFAAERVPIEVRGGKAPFAQDETIRPDTTVDALSLLRPVFKENGTITAGNASGLSDGAAMVLVASEQGVSRCGVKPMARVVATATAGGPPRDVFLTPIRGCQMVCQKAGWSLGDVDLWELNEAFAAQMLACMRGLELPADRVNIRGGAIALGHPLGASGARVLTTLLHTLQARRARKAVACLCLGGGNAVALALEAV